jgi:hypothetical protein
MLQRAGLLLKDTIKHCGASLLIPKPGQLNQLYHALANKHSHLRCYLKHEFIRKFPDFHMANTANAEGLFYEADLPFILDCGGVNATARCDAAKSQASHGWHHDEPDMWPLLVGHGPAFKRGFHLEPTTPPPWRRQVGGASSHVDLYSLMCHLLGLGHGSDSAPAF